MRNGHSKNKLAQFFPLNGASEKAALGKCRCPHSHQDPLPSPWLGASGQGELRPSPAPPVTAAGSHVEAPAGTEHLPQGPQQHQMSPPSKLSCI